MWAPQALRAIAARAQRSAWVRRLQGHVLVERPRYFTLGFTGDDIAGAWQHWRLAMEFHRAFEAHGLPPSFGVVEAAGEGEHPLYWFVTAEAAAVLDRHDVDWRRFLVRTDLAAPEHARPALTGAR